MKKNRYAYFILWMLVSFLISCDSMEDINRKYSEMEEQVYLGKVDSIQTFSGLNKIKITWYISSDPKIESSVIYWNVRQDSIVKPFTRKTPGIQKDSIIIENLSEGNYYFEFRNTNKKGESSLFSSATGVSLGENYLNSLINSLEGREPVSIDYNPEDYSTTIILSPTHDDMLLCSEVKYINNQGEEISLTIDREDDSFTMANISTKGSFELRSVFSLDLDIDDEILYSKYVTYFVPAPELHGISQWNPPGIPYGTYWETYYGIKFMWDNDIDTYYLVSAPELPYSFTFDLGKSIFIERFKLFQRQDIVNGETYAYDGQNLKTFQIWGSNTPDVTSSFDDWIKLGDFEIIKPSGLPQGQSTPEDVVAAASGHDFILDLDFPIRYIRVVAQSLWGGYSTIAVSEIKFFGFSD